jgi:hypothetical protein
MSTKEIMDKDIEFGKIFKKIWKYIRPLVPVYKKLFNDWASTADDDPVYTTVGFFIGVAGFVMGLAMLLSSFHLFFFISIPIGLLLLFFCASLIWFSVMGLFGRIDHTARHFNLKDWTYTPVDLEKDND